VEKIAGWVRWHKVRGRRQGRRLWELWTVSDGNGFQILRFTNNFETQHRELFAHKANHRKRSRSR
jgi:hypothetical protein